MRTRNTIQKDLILNAVHDMHRHVTADEVYAYIKNSHPNISKATVYRNLGILADDQKIRRIEISNGPDLFDYLLQKHYHVRCIKCGKVFDVDMDVVPGLENNIRNTYGIKFLDYDILFKGICPECQKMEEIENGK